MPLRGGAPRCARGICSREPWPKLAPKFEKGSSCAPWHPPPWGQVSDSTSIFSIAQSCCALDRRCPLPCSSMQREIRPRSCCLSNSSGVIVQISKLFGAVNESVAIGLLWCPCSPWLFGSMGRSARPCRRLQGAGWARQPTSQKNLQQTRGRLPWHAQCARTGEVSDRIMWQVDTLPEVAAWMGAAVLRVGATFLGLEPAMVVRGCSADQGLACGCCARQTCSSMNGSCACVWALGFATVRTGIHLSNAGAPPSSSMPAEHAALQRLVAQSG